ncbi:MAG: hydantoinase/oxoprolinase family protein [Chloroflexi bacterium]|nr:hydantoinase/oxoprolinase family protein [Chloroflexota bacterium]
MRIATDIGGTFTDLVFLDEETGAIGVTKSSSTPTNFALGVLNTIKKAAVNVKRTTFFVHGSTIIINALTERKGVRVGLITTKGFRDILEIARANRPDLYNMYYTKPKPFVPRYLRLEVEERLNYKGEELINLNEEDVCRAVEKFKAEKVEAIAVCFLHSYINCDHEVRCGEIIERLAPEIPTTLSHQITREWREYERTNTIVLNSYVKPIAEAYLDNLDSNLTGMGMGRTTLHVMQSNGGSATFASGKASPINLVESGPVAGVMGAAYIGELISEPNVIALDIGGTTAKTSLVENGTPKITTEYRIERTRAFPGYPILVPTIDIVEIGAGGGSIAWIDRAGALRVGPVSAGADPGPACYGWGGDKPTVTDANVLAGRINPKYFLGGEILLDIKKAEAAMRPIAEAFHISIAGAAMGVIRLADANMINALKLVSVRRGYDPRDFVLINFGGGGAMHAGALLRELHPKKVIIPTNPAVFSAWGMLMTDLRRDFIQTWVARIDQVDPAQINDIYLEMEKQALQALEAESIGRKNIDVIRFADMRYKGQEHTVKVPLPGGEFSTDNLPEITESFHRLHEQSYTFRLETPVELVNFHVTAFGRVRKPEIKKLDGPVTKVEEAYKGTRLVNFDELGFHDSRIYERDLLPVGSGITGPAVIEEPASVTVVFPDQRVIKDEYGFLHIEMVS